MAGWSTEENCRKNSKLPQASTSSVPIKTAYGKITLVSKHSPPGSHGHITCIAAKNYKPENFGEKPGMDSETKKMNRYKAL